MAAFHATYGLILVVLSILVLIWNLLRAAGRVKSNKIRMVFIGLLDLQVLLGVITLIMHHKGGLFLLHPAAMIVAVVLLHALTRESRPMRVQLMAYSSATALMILGVLAGGL